MFLLKLFRRVTSLTDQMILRHVNRRKEHSEEDTFFPLVFLCMLWIAALYVLRLEMNEPDKILNTILITAVAFCIVRHTKVSGTFLLAQIEATTLQKNNSAQRIREEANSLISEQESNSKKLLEALSSKYAKELRSEVLFELSQERSFLDSQMAELNLALIQAKESMNLLKEKEGVTRKKAAIAQQPLAQAQEQQKETGIIRQELKLECSALQDDVDKSEQSYAKNQEILSSLQSEIKQLKIRLENTQSQIKTYRNR